jgi:hypothetical protein
MFIDYRSKQRVEQQLYNEELKTVPVWLTDLPDYFGNGIALRDQAR